MLTVVKYIPSQMYGFLSDSDQEPGSKDTYFHLGSFHPKGPWPILSKCQKCPKINCAWVATPPPILGEEVVVTPNGIERVNAPSQHFGVVDIFDPRSGYGFIMGDDCVSYHLHRSEMFMRHIPITGARVMFYAGIRKNRPRACHIMVCTQ